ncbi:hypothetical protein BV22DRAFT_1115629 [Leucogyrophana mollusca]|uniref:Uncharacterized protein n=1 Tax=Leucogyrophana mollusca TaxID=85980 RepID=A0ACB8C125_9AGAM|nr:hypothetical protein BV22DRAFT_1115629 [Leucogyrophana mollusca]
MIGGTRKRNDNDDVVSDSEPEREERRQRRKDEGRARRKRKRLGGAQQHRTDIIELTDSEPKLPAPVQSAETIVIEHSPWTECAELPSLTPSGTASSPDLPASIQVLDAQDMHPGGTGVQATSLQSQMTVGKRSCPTPPPIATMEANVSSTFDEDEDSHRLNITRFAFPPRLQPQRSNSIPNVIESGPSDSVTVTDTAPMLLTDTKAKSKRIPSHRFTNDFSDSQLSRVIKCVSCEMRWTARKSAAQKMLHIQVCAKKKLLSDDTVRALLHKEMEVFDKNKRKDQQMEEDNRTTTFLDAVVNPPKKPGRRLKIQNTVKALPETRKSILDKARLVLGKSAQAQAGPNDTQPFEQRRLAGNSEISGNLPCTQAFGESALGRRASTMDNGLTITDSDLLQSRWRMEAAPHLQKGLGESTLVRRTNTMGFGLFDAQNHPSQMFGSNPSPPSHPIGTSKLATVVSRLTSTSNPGLDCINNRPDSTMSSDEVDELIGSPRSPTCLPAPMAT